MAILQSKYLSSLKLRNKYYSYNSAIIFIVSICVIYQQLLLINNFSMAIQQDSVGLSQQPDKIANPLTDDPRLILRSVPDPSEKGEIHVGKFKVYENRTTREGRVLELDLVILHATGDNPKPDPMFILHGGPGVAATTMANGYVRSWMRVDRDIILIDQRGTGGTHALRCTAGGDDNDLQGYLDSLFDLGQFSACAETLAKNADLRFYTTPVAMDDLDELREALGYDTINLYGGSYGTRAALVYLRRHTEHARTATLNGVAPIAFANPLFHARGAQDTLELIFDECANDPDCNAAFPELSDEFDQVLQRLENDPAKVTVKHPVTGEEVHLLLTRDAFAEALRVIMYYSSRDVPLLIHRAFTGDYDYFAQRGLESNRSIRNMISIGMLLCVTCNEDLPRIDEDAIIRETAGTFLGDVRVRQQKAICDIWPKADIPENYTDPVCVSTPVLIFSGTLDPVTPPRWGEEAASHLPNSLHVVAPGYHGLGGPCIESIFQLFLENGSVDNLDTACVDNIHLGKFILAK